VGCAGSYDPRNQKIALDLIKILEHSGVNYAVLGKEETCTGDSARRLGDEYLFETLAQKNIETMGQYKFKRVVASCPHCLHTISKEYPDFGGNYEVIHHTQLIEELMASGDLHLNNVIDDKITYHDACYLGRHNDIYEAPRNIIKDMMSDKAEYVEMKESRSSSMCCGAGGGNMWHEINDGDRINVTRFEQAMETGAETVATACSFCAIMMDDAMKVKGQEEKMQILDVAELVAKGID
jgi:Fe-S oxidoreductase